jgi:hypothetical protein
MTKQQALKQFRETRLPAVRRLYESDGRVDRPARCQEWNMYVDYLHADKLITTEQAETWSNPF